MILSAHTFVASAGAVKAVGADPVFAEIGADHLMISKLDGIGPMEEALQALGVYGP